MRIIPAIDLKGGKCVRLYKGDFEQVTEYNDDPGAVAREYGDLDLADLHIVDLDGARSGTQENAAVVKRLCAEAGFDIQLGGGIRHRDTVQYWLENGVARCVLGSFALADPEGFEALLRDLGPAKLVLALDVNRENGVPVVATHGWTRSSGQSLWDCIDHFGAAGLQHVLCTDISRDGAMTGPNVELYAEVVERYPGLQLQASGGIRNIGDIRALADAGIPAAITGKALLEQKITATEIRSFLQNG
jgi:phosphoribosylformimino-5-aminoimidazole carboxamide ribotide isomerase